MSWALEGFHAPEEARGEGSLHTEIRPPDRKNLRTLINALEATLGFGNCLDWRDPETFGIRSMEVDADALPSILDLEMRCRQHSREPEVLGARRSDEEPVCVRRSKKIDHRFQADKKGSAQRRSERQRHFAAHFAALRRRAEPKAFGHLQN